MKLRAPRRARYLACFGLLVWVGPPSAGLAVPVITPGLSCFFAPLNANCVDIGYVEGPFDAPTDQRILSVVANEQIFGASAIRADNSLLGDPSPAPTSPTDHVAAGVKLVNDGINNLLRTEVSGSQSLRPLATGEGPAESTLNAKVKV